MRIDDENRKMNPLPIEEIENKLKKIHALKKAEIEANLRERIRLYKKEAEEKMSRIKEKIDEEKKTFSDYKAFIHEMKNAGYITSKDL